MGRREGELVFRKFLLKISRLLPSSRGREIVSAFDLITRLDDLIKSLLLKKKTTDEKD